MAVCWSNRLGLLCCLCQVADHHGPKIDCLPITFLYQRRVTVGLTVSPTNIGYEVAWKRSIIGRSSGLHSIHAGARKTKHPPDPTTRDEVVHPIPAADCITAISGIECMRRCNKLTTNPRSLVTLAPSIVHRAARTTFVGDVRGTSARANNSRTGQSTTIAFDVTDSGIRHIVNLGSAFPFQRTDRSPITLWFSIVQIVHFLSNLGHFDGRFLALSGGLRRPRVWSLARYFSLISSLFVIFMSAPAIAQRAGVDYPTPEQMAALRRYRPAPDERAVIPAPLPLALRAQTQRTGPKLIVKTLNQTVPSLPARTRNEGARFLGQPDQALDPASIVEAGQWLSEEAQAPAPATRLIFYSDGSSTGGTILHKGKPLVTINWLDSTVGTP